MEDNGQLKISQEDLEILSQKVRRVYGLGARKRQISRAGQEFMVGRANASKSNFASGVEPSYEQIHRIAVSMEFGAAEAIALSALLFSVWSHFDSRVSRQTSKCRKLSSGKRCGHEFVYQERVVENGMAYITLWCIKKHETKLRVS